ncbi:hypothetical protein KAH81_08450 [bacterium]|nr:hypothetical protein [bacterium]
MAKIIKNNDQTEKQPESFSEKRYTQFRDRLIRVRTTNRLWTVLENQNFFTCGYCGHKMALYSPLSLTGREEEPSMFYGCSRRCESSGIHRYQFIDTKLIKFIYERFRGLFPNLKGDSKHVKKLTKKFEEIARHDAKRRHLLELLPHAGFNRDDLLKELINLEETIESMRDNVSGFSKKKPEKSTLFAPIFLAETPGELLTLDLLYLRELVGAAIYRIRFFNETLVLRVTPLTEEEHRFNREGGGKLFNIHLQYDPRSLDMKTISNDEENEDKSETPAKEDRKKYAFERVDVDFIMKDEEPESDYAGHTRSAEKVDLELLLTEPGSTKEKEILKQRAKKPKDDNKKV